VGCAGNMAHERFWMIRGMENLNIDYYENMPEVKRLGAKLLEFHKVIIDRYAKQPGFPAPVTSWRKPVWLEDEVRKFMRRKSAQKANISPSS